MYMQSLKQKWEALRLLLESKFIQVSLFFAHNFIACLVVLIIPVLIIYAVLFWKSKEVEEVLKQPTFSSKKVKSLEKRVSLSQDSVAAYKKKSDSLTVVVHINQQVADTKQATADSLHTIYEKEAPTWTASSLRSYLSSYKPSPDSL